MILTGLLSSISKSKAVVKRHPITVLTLDFYFVPDGFLSCPGIGVIFSFYDMTIAEGKGNPNYFRFFRFPFPCTG